MWEKIEKFPEILINKIRDSCISIIYMLNLNYKQSISELTS